MDHSQSFGLFFAHVGFLITACAFDFVCTDGDYVHYVLLVVGDGQKLDE